MTPNEDTTAAAQALLAPWPGPCGGLPPYDQATPAALEQALRQAVQTRREAVRAIASDPRAPSFDNTVAALEDSARTVREVHALLGVVASTANLGEMPAVAQRVAALVPELAAEIAHHRALFARVEAVWRGRHDSGLDAQQRRLVEVVHDRMVRAGARLGDTDQMRLRMLDAQLARLAAQFNRNLQAEEASQVVWLESESELEGLPDAQRHAAARAAQDRGRPGAWAIPNQRPAVWPFLTHSTRRDLRERVWRMWSERGAHAGEHDNRPVVSEMLRQRGERARLLGHPSHAHAVLGERMARTPQNALAMLRRTWEVVLKATQRQIEDFETIARAEGADFELAPWDRLHYAEKLRRQRFALDSERLMQHLPLDAVVEAMQWAAGRVHGLDFHELHGVPVLHPSVRVFEARRAGEAIGALYLDLHSRPGKAHGSHQRRVRAAECAGVCAKGHPGVRVLPIAHVVSGVPTPREGQSTLLPWEYANVLFHEFGHALHMLLDGARYPSLGSQDVAWDMVELPALLNEYWLRDRELLRRFARHSLTGEPMPDVLVERLEAALRYDRIFSVNLDYLGTAIVDLELHLLADGSGCEIDAVEVERRTLEALGMPACWDLVLRVPHSVHSFAGAYDAGLYAYLWSDVMAADVAEAFAASSGGFYDAGVAQAWRERLLSVGNSVPAADAFRALRGRDPDPQALLRRFALA